MLRGDELRFHRQMASFAAELDRFCDLVGLVTPQRCHEQKEHRHGRENPEKFTVSRPRQVNFDNQRLSRFDRLPVSAPLQNRAEQSDDDAENEKSWGEHISQNPDVRISVAGELINRDEKKEGKARWPRAAIRSS